MFEDIFSKIHNKNREIKIMGIWGKDGLVLEKKFFSEIREVDVELTGAELADILSKLNGMKLSIEKYFITLQFKGYSLLIFSLTSEYFFMVVTDPAIIPGKLNFYFNLYKNKLISAL